MEFLLGLFTGAALMMLLGFVLNEREKNRHRKDRKEMLAHLFGRSINYDGEWLSGIIRDPRTTEEQLRDAIARDDFEEAARLRNLMNKK